MSSSFCSLDPMPPWLLIECFNELETVLLFVVNESLKIGYFPSILKKTLLKPTVKDMNDDLNNLKNYRPVSNLSFLSKIVESVAYEQINGYLNLNQLYTLFSAIRI